VIVANAGLPKTIAVDVVGNVTGATMALIGNATALNFLGNSVGNLTGTYASLSGNVGASFVNATGGIVAGNAVVGGGVTVANANGLHCTGFVYADTFAVGNASSFVGSWRKSDGLLTAPAATITGRLTVQGAGAEFTGDKYFLSNPPGTNPAGNIKWNAYPINTQPISIVTSHGIYMQGGDFWKSSDSRKKFAVEEESPEACAEAVRASRLVAYDIKDAPGRQLGFLAQQVANVVHGSVTLVREAIPSVMRLANVATPRSFVLEGASESLVGEHVVGVRLVQRGGGTTDAPILFVSGDVVTLEDPVLTGSDVFVYGPVVDDFHALDYQRMWAMAFGAVKHLLEKGDEKDAELAALRGRVGAAESAIEELRARFDAVST
jgi:hypothetical protein